MMPKRVQMTRRRGGWRKEHPDAVIVARPTKWGNPYAGDGASIDRALVVRLFEEYMARPEQDEKRRQAVAELRGRDLACWCPLDEPCHADVLLRIANAEGESTP